MIGIIEPYNSGFLEVVPEGEGSDYWQIAAIHINGEAFRPSPRLYRSQQIALAKATQIYDWIADHEQQISFQLTFAYSRRFERGIVRFY